MPSRLGLAVLLAIAWRVHAGQILPAGPEFRLSRGSNGYTSDGYAQYPRITSVPGGEFVVVWKSYYSTYSGYVRGVAGGRSRDKAGNGVT